MKPNEVEGAKNSNFFTHTTTNGADKIALAANFKRKTITIMYSGGSSAWFKFGSPAANNDGFLISNPGPAAFVLKTQDFGPGIQLELHSFGNAGAGQYYIMEGFDD